MDELIRLINQYKNAGYTPKLMEQSVRRYLEDDTTPFEGFSIDDVICGLEEEMSCWEE